MIPNKIHMIWVGSKFKRPDAWIATWREKNPDWEFRLWDDDDVMNVPWQLGKHIKSLYRKGRFNGVSDLMRLEILLREGGIYADADSVCLRPLTEELTQPEFWGAYENEKALPGIVQNAFLGSVPGHPLLQSMVDKLAKRRNVIKKWTWRGRVRLPFHIATGPHFITREIRQHGSNGVTIFPSWYFFPVSVTREHYDGPGQPYADHFYSTAFGTYEVHGWRRPMTSDPK